MLLALTTEDPYYAGQRSRSHCDDFGRKFAIIQRQSRLPSFTVTTFYMLLASLARHALGGLLAGAGPSHLLASVAFFLFSPPCVACVRPFLLRLPTVASSRAVLSR